MNPLFTGLSAKDIAYISDITRMLVVRSKKIENYEQSIQDDQVRNQLHEVRILLNNQCDQLLGVLKNG